MYWFLNEYLNKTCWKKAAYKQQGSVQARRSMLFVKTNVLTNIVSSVEGSWSVWTSHIYQPETNCCILPCWFFYTCNAKLRCSCNCTAINAQKVQHNLGKHSNLWGAATKSRSVIVFSLILSYCGFKQLDIWFWKFC